MPNCRPRLPDFFTSTGTKPWQPATRVSREAEDPQIWSFAEAGAWIVVTFQWIFLAKPAYTRLWQKKV